MTPRSRQRSGSSGGYVPRWQWLCVAAIALALGIALVGHGGRDLAAWDISLILIALTTLICWLLAPGSRAVTDLPAPTGPLLLLFPAFLVLQLIPLPLFAVRLLSPGKARIVNALSAFTMLPVFSSLSIDPEATGFHLLRVLGYLVVFLLIRQLAIRSGRPWLMAVPLVVLGALEAALGLMQAGFGGETVGLYRNKNHLAGLLEMILPLAIGCVITLLKNPGSRSKRKSRRIILLALAAAAAAMAFALTMTLSKAGFVGALGGLFCIAALAVSASLEGRRKWAVLGVVVLVFLALSVAIPSGALANAFGDALAEKTGEGRLPVWSDAFHLIAAYPLFGSGFGTFRLAFLQFQTAVVDYNFEFAHNDYLEAVTELGVPGFALLAAIVIPLCALALRTSRPDADPHKRYVAWGCCGAIAAISIHSLADFNLYLPANALVLAWILGIVASFPPARPAEQEGRFMTALTQQRWLARSICIVLLVWSAAGFFLESQYREDPAMEQFFCRFGVCDTEARIEAVAAKHKGDMAALPFDELLLLLKREPADPARWTDLGDAMARAGRTDQAKYCYARALALAPDIPPVDLKVAGFFAATGARDKELELTSRVLATSAESDSQVFTLYEKEKIGLQEVLARGIPPTARAARALLRRQMLPGTASNAAAVWDWTLLHGLADDATARDYVNFLYHNHAYETAAEAWTRYRGNQGGGFLQANWIANGDFETEPAGIPYDWDCNDSGKDVTATVDRKTAHTGSRSLQLHFAGRANVAYHQCAETAFLLPGHYRFTAWIRTEGITGDQGIGFRLFDAEKPTRLDLRTEQVKGTTDWKPVSITFEAPQTTRLLTVQVARERSTRLDGDITGTVWIDTVTLSRTE